jgi:hypothetical protein
MPNTTAPEYLNDLAARMRASAARQPDDLAAALLELAAHADRLAADLTPPAPTPAPAALAQDPRPPFYDCETGLVVTELGVFGSWQAFYRAQVDYMARALRDAPAAA